MDSSKDSNNSGDTNSGDNGDTNSADNGDTNSGNINAKKPLTRVSIHGQIIYLQGKGVGVTVSNFKPTKESANASSNKGKKILRYSNEEKGKAIQIEVYHVYHHHHNNGRIFIVNGHEVDNRDVVPYNSHLSRMFDCHINVEVCAGLRCVKYIHKYIYKGHDRTTMVLGDGM